MSIIQYLSTYDTQHQYHLNIPYIYSNFKTLIDWNVSVQQTIMVSYMHETQWMFSVTITFIPSVHFNI